MLKIRAKDGKRIFNRHQDTHTLRVSFNNNEITDTKDLNENVLDETDKNDNVVSMTVEYAQQHADIANFSFNQVENTGAFYGEKERHFCETIYHKIYR